MNPDMNPESKPQSNLARPIPELETIAPASAPSNSARVVPGLRPGMTRSAPAAPISPTSVLRALRRRSALALGVAILLASIAGPASWFLVPPAKYRAQARMQVVAQPPKVLFRTVETESLSGEEYKRYQSTQLTLVKSHMVLNAAIQDGKVSRYAMVRGQVDPIAWLQEALKVEFVAGSEVMEISLSGDDPHEVAGIVNAVKKAFMEEVVNVDLKRRADRHSMLRKTKERYAGFLKERRETLRKLAETVGSNDRQTLALRQQYAMEQVADIRKELREVQSQKRKVEAQLKTLRLEDSRKVAQAPTFTKADVDRAIDRDAIVAALLVELAGQEQRYKAEMANLNRVSRNAAGDPVQVRLHAEIQATRRSLASRRKELRPQVIRQLQEPGEGERVAPGAEAEQELAVLNEIEQQLDAEIEVGLRRQSVLDGQHPGPAGDPG